MSRQAEDGWDRGTGFLSKWVDGGRRIETAILCGNGSCNKPINPGDETVTVSPATRVGALVFHKGCAPKGQPR